MIAASRRIVSLSQPAGSVIMAGEPMRSLLSRWTLPFCFVLIVTGKFLLVGRNEILALADDSAGYVKQSLREWTLDFPPGYSVWLRIGSALGAPQRIEIEALYLLGAALVALGIRKCFGTFAAILTFALLAFTPSTFLLFDHALSDVFFVCLTLLGLALSVHLFLVRTTTGVAAYSAGLGLLLGIMASTRNEDPLIALWILSVVLTSAVVWRHGTSAASWESWRRPVFAALITTTVTASIVLAVGLSFYFVNGIFARSISLIPGHVKLLQNLAEIDTGQPQLRSVPISRKSRELAYSVSPNLARVRAGVEDPEYVFQVASREAGLPNGEIGGGWIWHAINGQVFTTCGGSLKNMEAFYIKVNHELSSAFRDHRLKRRFVLHPLIGQDIRGVLARIPASIAAVATSSFAATPDYVHDEGFQPEMFDKALLRRSALIGRASQVVVEGWAFADDPARKIVSTLAASKDSSPSLIKFVDRPDVEKGIQAEKGWRPHVVGFNATLETHVPDKVSIRYLLDDGTEVIAEDLKTMQVSAIKNKASSSKIIQGIDIIRLHTFDREDPGYKLQLWLIKLTELRWISKLAMAVIALSFIANGYLWLKRRGDRQNLWIPLFGFMFALWCGRILFYSVIDAAAWEANQMRYLAPAHALGLVLLSLSIAGLMQLPLKLRQTTGKETKEEAFSSRDASPEEDLAQEIREIS